MKILRVSLNHHRKAFVIAALRREYLFPYAKADPRPSERDPVRHASVDLEIGREGFTYVLASGREGSVHIEQVLKYNQDPGHLRERLLYRLTLEARRRVAASPLSKREIIRRLGTSAAQFYRLLDPANTRKSVDALLSLLHVLDCDVDLAVRSRSA
ncbi:MAG: XRE family transcriptional regulator [Planctomycetes bacterium]|nr:XRE family transcriptional regulator [Planctomycetota bacterium]